LNNQPKILLASTINVVKSYCLFDWLEHIKELDYPNLDIFLVDNSPSPDFSNKIQGLGFNCVWEDPKGRESRYFMTASNERCRVKFLSNPEYTHFYSLECDIFPPKDIIQKLLAHDKDVCGTTYWSFQGYDSQLMLWNIDVLHTDYENRKKEAKARLMTFSESQLFIDGQCKPVYANGIGCTLIKRWVLEKIHFRIDPLDIGHADSFFHQDLWLNGIENYVDTSIIPLHRNSNWNTLLTDTGHKRMAVKRGDIQLKK
jgi:hypothetical protein